MTDDTPMPKLSRLEVITTGAKVEVRGFARKKPARPPLPDHLPRERTVYPAAFTGRVRFNYELSRTRTRDSF